MTCRHASEVRRGCRPRRERPEDRPERGVGLWVSWALGRIGLLLVCGAALSVGAGSTAYASDGRKPGGPQEEEHVIRLFVGRSTVVTAPWPVKTVSVTDPKVANVEVLTDRLVLVQGKSAGSTDIILLGEQAEVIWQARIDVGYDIGRIKGELAAMFPDCQLDVAQSDGVLVLSGTLARATQVERLHGFLKAYDLKYVDMTQLAGVQQVELFVRVAEVSRVAMRSLGFNGFLAGENFRDAFVVSQLGQINPINIGAAGNVNVRGTIPFVTDQQGIPISGATTLSLGFPRVTMQLFIQALAENQYLRILAEPRLVALSGEEASFLAGGEFPIPIPQTGAVGATTITIEYKEFGVRLRFRPTVLGDNNIRLLIAPEVSELSDAGAVEILGFRVPALVVRKAETTLELKSGQTFSMAGLLQETNRGRNARVPGLGDLPVLGALFRSVRYEQGETELVVLVTASLVDPLSVESVPPLPGTLHTPPNDWDLYLEGRLEGGTPKISPADAAWLKETGLHRLKGPGAWVTYDSPPAQSRSTLGPPRLMTSPVEPDTGQVKSSGNEDDATQATAAPGD